MTSVEFDNLFSEEIRKQRRRVRYAKRRKDIAEGLRRPAIMRSVVQDPVKEESE